MAVKNNSQRHDAAATKPARYTGREGLNHWIREGLYGPPDAAPVEPAPVVGRSVLGDPDARSANRSPLPRLREADGTPPIPTPKSFHPTPEHKLLLQVYADALENIRAVLPLRAARLEDLMRRVDESLLRLQVLREEEEHRKKQALTHLEKRRAELEAELESLTRLLEQKHLETEPLVQQRLDAWCRARQAAAWVYAAAGQDFPHAEDGELRDSLRFIPVADELPEAEGHAHTTGPVSEASAPDGAAPSSIASETKSLGKRLMGFIGLDRTMAGSKDAVAQQEAADAADPAGPESVPAASDSNGATPEPAVGRAEATGATPDGQVHEALAVSPPTPERHRTGEWMRRLIPKRATTADVAPPAAESAYHADRPPFDPIAEARRQVRNERAIAAELCLPYPSSAETSCDGKSHLVARWLAMVALGSIFGMSIGLIMELFQPKLIAEEPSMWGMAAICIFFGICAFWGMGRLASMLTAVAAEGLMHEAFADADTMFRKFRTRALAAWWIAVVTIVALIIIEALVENQGIVGSLIKAGSKTTFAAAPTAPTGLESLGVFLVCLVVSGPFVLFHATEGWIEARAAAIQYRLKNIHEEEVFERADELRAAYDEVFPPFGQRSAGERAASHPALQPAPRPSVDTAHGDRLHKNHEPGNGHSAHPLSGDGVSPEAPDAAGGAASEAAVAVLPEHPHPAADPWENAPLSMLTDAADAEPAEETYTVPRVDGACELDADLPGWSGEVAPMHVAVARERVFQTARRLQEARADQYETLLPIRARRAELDGERLALATETEADAVAHQRLDDAYHDYVMATRLFDEEFRTILDMLEQVTRRRAVRKWWKRILRRMAGEKPEDLESATIVTKVKKDEPAVTS